MAATRLSDSQKSELVERFRAGEGSQALASAFGCSAATVTRTVRAALSPEEYDRLKAPAGRRAAGSPATAPLPKAPGSELPEVEPEPPEAPQEPETAQGVLAIDDADDFGADDEGPEDDVDDDDDETAVGAVAVLSALGISPREGPAVEARPLADATLPTSAYMLVDKTVELQARALSEFPELGPLPPGEQERQALVVYVNPRQAKRQCGRSQRVIKIPDLGVFALTSRYLTAQGISRLLIEGDLYSLPGS
jgi:hypothetical protein